MAFANPFRRKPSETPEQIIKRHAKWAGGIGAAGSFGMHSDTVVVGGIWVVMIYRLAKNHDVPLSWGGAAKVAAALTTSAIAFTSGVKAATTYFAWTGVGTPVAMATNVTVNAALTYAAGQAVSDVFRKDDPTSGKAVATIITGARESFQRLVEAKLRRLPPPMA